MLINTQLPTKTRIPPKMKVLDNEHALVDCDGCFNIPNFSKLKSASVLLNGFYKASVTTNYDKIKNLSNKVYPNLGNSMKIKVGINPCLEQRFYVRITYEDSQSFVDSISAIYVPAPMENVSI